MRTNKKTQNKQTIKHLDRKKKKTKAMLTDEILDSIARFDKAMGKLESADATLTDYEM